MIFILQIEEYLVEWDRLDEEDEIDSDLEEQKGLDDERISKFKIVIVTSQTSFECCPVCLGMPKKGILNTLSKISRLIKLTSSFF